MEKRRILQVNLDGTGGAFSLMYQIQKRLQNKYTFDFFWMGKFARNEKVAELKEKGSFFYEADLRKNRVMGHILLPFRFYKFLKKHPYEVVHINADLAYKLLLYAWPAYSAGVKKIIIHSHSSGVNGDHKWIKTIFHNICKPLLRKKANTFLTCSKLASKWMFGDPEFGIMVKNGVDTERYRFNPAAREMVRRQLNVSNEILIGTVGNLSFQKNPEFLINIMTKLDSNYRLIFVGDGENREKVENYAKEKMLLNRIIFTGNSEHVNDILSAMDIFVMPSRFEGLPVSAIEAQACGLPCLFSDQITEETKVLPSCYFLPINNGIEVWVNQIINMQHTSNGRENAADILKKKGFDINDSAALIAKIYSES